ncbi:MAG: ABC transporter ATP-binding protein [Pseudomonadota bacterium]
MKTTMGGFQEETLGKQRDITLLRRFIPLLRSNLSMIALSVGLMLLISGLDIAAPYVTRTAVDRYILPTGQKHKAHPETKDRETELFFSIHTREAMAVVDAHPGLFTRSEDGVRIAPGDLTVLSRQEIRTLRQEDLSGAARAGILLVAIALAQFIFGFVQIMIMEYAGQKMMHDLRIFIYAHIQRLPVTFFTQNTVGRLSTRVTNDIQNMQEMFTTIITFVMQDLFTMAGIVAVLVSMDLKLSAALFTVVPVVVAATWLFSGKSREIYRTIRIKTAEINSMFSECIGGIKVIQLFNREARTIRDFSQINHDNYRAGISQIVVYGMFMPVIDLFGSATLAIIIYFGGGRVVSQVISLGTLIAFISYAKMFFRPLRDVAEKHNILQDALSSGERITQILDKTKEDTGGALELTHIRDLAFDRVSFAYQTGEPVLDNVSFSISQGESLAIVGPTGSGKTSLINLIVKFHTVSDGRILINKIPIDTYTTRSLRSRIAVVNQDPYLFSGTIGENILPPGTDLPPGELDLILRRSHVASILDNLPQGIDTRISQGGTSLSSGERQLISIARAFAHKPDLIVFDEATSYVDTESEEKIRLAVAELKENRTSITIAHRLRSATTADRIMVLINGRIAETGNHQTLMENRRFYFRLNTIDA